MTDDHVDDAAPAYHRRPASRGFVLSIVGFLLVSQFAGLLATHEILSRQGSRAATVDRMLCEQAAADRDAEPMLTRPDLRRDTARFLRDVDRHDPACAVPSHPRPLSPTSSTRPPSSSGTARPPTVVITRAPAVAPSTAPARPSRSSRPRSSAPTRRPRPTRSSRPTATATPTRSSSPRPPQRCISVVCIRRLPPLGLELALSILRVAARL